MENENIKTIPLPSTISVEPLTGKEHAATIIVSPCYPGYGTTLGNALRRVLLSSLPGVAAIEFKIKGVDHEFSTVPHIQEDIVEMILNIKSLRFRLHSDEPVELELHAKGEGVVTAASFKKNSQVEIVNPDAVIATITDKAGELNLKVIIAYGRGYVPVESRVKEKREVGYIAIDSIYTPVRNVNFRTEHVRVGQMTNYDKLLINITTDGTMPPEEAFHKAAAILVEQFQYLAAIPNEPKQADGAEVESVKEKKKEGEEENEQTEEEVAADEATEAAEDKKEGQEEVESSEEE